MIKGIGIDIIELERVKEILERQPKFVDRVLTDAEQDSFLSLPTTRKIEFLSGRFAAKEAFAKATGTGIGKELSFLDIEIRPDINGKPEIIYHKQQKTCLYHVSISHSKQYAVAQVIIENF